MNMEHFPWVKFGTCVMYGLARMYENAPARVIFGKLADDEWRSWFSLAGCHGDASPEIEAHRVQRELWPQFVKSAVMESHYYWVQNVWISRELTFDFFRWIAQRISFATFTQHETALMIAEISRKSVYCLEFENVNVILCAIFERRGTRVM